MDKRTRRAAQRLVLARQRYMTDRSLRNLRAYERAAERYRAAQAHTRPGYLKGERL